MSTEPVHTVDVRKKALPDLILVLESSSPKDGLRVYALGFEGGSIIFKFLFAFNHNNIDGMGFAVSGTKLIAVGGEWRKSPKDVKIWDLFNWRHREKFEMEKDQTLGEKPYPVVFEFQDRIFALAGMECPESRKPRPLFEVFNLYSGGGWQELPDPPFKEDYCKGFSPRIRYHSVIDETLYVGLIDVAKQTWKYYSYSIHGRSWDTLNTAEVTPVVKNFINNCQVQNISPVDENKMVFTCRRNMEVYACDLNSEVEAQDEPASPLPPLKTPKMTDYFSDENMSMSADDQDECDYDSDDYFFRQDVLPSAYLPVGGFQGLRKRLPKRFSISQMVAHLSGDTYCLVYFYLPLVKEAVQNIQVVTFNAPTHPCEKHRLTAEIIRSETFTIDLRMKLRACCKFKFRV